MINCGDHVAYTCEECEARKGKRIIGDDFCAGSCMWSVEKAACIKKYAGNKSPNIIFVLADDLELCFLDENLKH